MNDLESLLNQERLDVLNRHSVLQHSVIDIPRGIPTESMHSKADGNAQLYDFIKMVGLIIESMYSDKEAGSRVTYMPRSHSYFSREDSDQRFSNPIITYQVFSREIKQGTSKYPQLRESRFEKDDDRTVNIYTTTYSSIVRFQFLALEYETAFKLMDEFEDMMIEYMSYIKGQGVCHYYMLKQQPDDYNVDNRDFVDQLTLDYYVETQKNRVIFKENAKTLIINGEAVDNDFNPIPANPEYLKK